MIERISRRQSIKTMAGRIRRKPYLVLSLGLVTLMASTVFSQTRHESQAANSRNDTPDQVGSLSLGLGALPLLSTAETRSISAENPTGGKGQGAMAIPDPKNTEHLSRGWKVRPFLNPKAGQTVTLMDVDGPGIIQHIWMVSGEWGIHGRTCVLRFYWDGEAKPSVEVPVTDFFAVGHDKFAPVNSQPVVVNASSALNSFWPMPFRKHARITFANESQKNIDVLAYQITYALMPVPSGAGYFHAQWRRASTDKQNPYVILDGVKGRGRYVGTFLAVSQLSDGWFGEGEVKFYLDGDQDFPTISGTGTEDYFLSSYGFPHVYNTLYSGLPLKDGVRDNNPGGNAGAKWSMYRWHILDPINFQRDLRVTIQALGGGKGPGFSLSRVSRYGGKRSDDFASVAYWYQTEPHAPFPPFPPVEERVREAHALP